MVNVNGQSGFEREPLPEWFESELADVDARLADAMGRIDVPSGLEERVFAASVSDLPVREAVAPRGYSFVHVLRTRWISSGRLAMAACLALMCVVGSWMLHANKGNSRQVASGPNVPMPSAVMRDAEADNGAMMLASLESMSTDSVAAADGGWLWMDYGRQEISFDELDQEMSAMMQSLGAGDEM